MISIILEIIRETWRQRRLLFTTSILMRLVSLILLWPLFGSLMRRLIATSGQDALTDQEIATFLLSPLGMGGAIVCGAIGICIMALEQSSLVVQSFAASQGWRVTSPSAIWHSLRELGSTTLLCLMVIVRSLLLAAPLLAGVGLVAWLLLSDVDINYYMTARPAKFWIAVGLAAAILLAGVWVIVPRLASWSLALPVLLISRVSPWGALQTSRELVGNYRWSIAGGWLAWFLFHATLSSVFSSLVYSAARLTIASTTQWLPVLVPILGLFLLLFIVGGLVLSLYQGISFALIVSSLYRRLGWEGEHGSALRQQRGENWLSDYFRDRLGAEPIEKAEPERSLRLSDPADRIDKKSWRWLWLTAGLSAVAIASGLWLLLSLNSTEDAIVLAHRGAAGLRPENTLAAFDKACEDKTDFVELDVQESADGEVIVFHDSDYMKIAGVKLKAWDATLPELAKIDIGSGFSPEYRDQRTPLLRDALRLCKGRSKVDIELKYYGHNQRLVEKVIEIVEQEGMVDQIVLMSLYHPFVEEAKRLRPTWTVGLLAAVTVGDVTRLSSDFVALNTQSTTRATIDLAHRRGKSVYVWTIDNPVLMSYYLGLGVDGLITNRPDLAREVIEQLREMSPAERLLLDGSVRLGIVPAENKADVSENGA